MSRIQVFFWVALFFFLPTQFGKHLWPDFAYLFGLRSVYLAPILYLTYGLVSLLLLFHGRLLLRALRSVPAPIIVVSIVLIGCNVFFASRGEVSSLVWSKYVALAALGYLVYRRKAALIAPFLIASAFACLLQLILTLFQFNLQSSLQGVWYFLGERSVYPSLPDVAKIVIQGREYLRPYGTFSHPNSLGGFYCALYFVALALQTKDNKTRIAKSVVLVSCSLLVFISFSKTAIIVFALLNTFLVVRDPAYRFCQACKYARPLVLATLCIIFLSFTGDPGTLTKRFDLLSNALTLIVTHPFWGVGMGNYTIAQASFASSFNLLHQPVHNIFLLFLTEAGLLIAAWVSWGIYRIKQTGVTVLHWTPLAAITLTGMLDHYWLTLPQNLLLLSLTAGFFVHKSLPRPSKSL